MATSNTDVTDDRIPRIASTIRVIPDFPKPGEALDCRCSVLLAYMEGVIELIFFFVFCFFFCILYLENVDRDLVSGYYDVAA